MGSKKLIIMVVWLVVLASVATVLRLFVFPAKKQQELDATSSSSQYEHEIAIGLDGFSGYSILRSEPFQRRLKDSKIKVEYKDDKADTIRRIKGLQDESLDLAVFTLDSLIASSIEISDFPGTIILVIDETRGADAIVARTSSVPNLQALNNSNARIVGTSNSPSEFLSRTVRANFNLPDMNSNWFEGVDGPDEVMKKLKAGSSEPRAYALWEPYVSQAKEIDGVDIIFDSSAVRGHVVDVLVARRGFLTNNYEQAKEVVEAYLSTSYEYRKPESMVDLVIKDAKALGDPLRRPQAQSIVDGIIWRNTLENFAYFGMLHRHESGGITHIEDSIVTINDVLIKTGAVPDNNKVVGSENLLYFDGIMNDLQSSNFHPKTSSSSSSATTLGDALNGSGGSLEAVRSDTELVALSDNEWNRLIAVGQIKTDPINFGRNSTKLFPQGQRDLRKIADTLKSFPNYYLQIVGNVSFVPSPDMDQNEIEEIRKASSDLAEARANAVSEYLNSIGVHKNRIRSVASAPSKSSKGSVSFLVGQKTY